MGRAGHQVARCTVERLMRAEGLKGVQRAKSPRTTRPKAETERPADLVERKFVAERSNQLWVADITYIRTYAGWVYAAFIIDVYSRMVVGWQLSKNLYTDLALDALNMAIWQRTHAGDDLSGLIHHSDRGVQYRALRYTKRLAEQDLVASVGSRGDSYDNALAEAFNSLFKAELIRNRHKGPWRDIEDLEIAVAEYIDWFGPSTDPRRDRLRPTGRVRSPTRRGRTTTRARRRPHRHQITTLYKTRGLTSGSTSAATAARHS